MNKYTKTADSKDSLILFLVSPFLALFYSLSFNKQGWAKNIFWLFCIYFGYTLVLSPDSQSDGVRYVESFVELSKTDIGSADLIDKLYSDDSGYIDIAQPLVTLLLSRITNNTHVLFAMFGLIFGYFHSRNLWYLFKTLNVKSYSFALTIFVLTFVLLDPVWSIIAFRFHTAMQVFLFGALPFLMEGKRKGLYIAALSVFVHFTFALPVLLLFMYSWIGDKMRFFFVLFVITSFTNELDLNIVKSTLNEEALPAIFQKKVDIYVNDDVKAETAESLRAVNWYVRYNALLIKIVSYTFLLVIFFNYKLILKSKGLKSLFCFTLFSYSFANMASFFPQGIRFSWVGNLMAFFLIACCISGTFKVQLKLEKLTYLLMPFMLIIVIVAIRRGFDFTGLFTILGNPFVLPFNEFDLPLINLIK